MDQVFGPASVVAELRQPCGSPEEPERPVGGHDREPCGGKHGAADGHEVRTADQDGSAARQGFLPKASDDCVPFGVRRRGLDGVRG